MSNLPSFYPQTPVLDQERVRIHILRKPIFRTVNQFTYCYHFDYGYHLDCNRYSWCPRNSDFFIFCKKSFLAAIELQKIVRAIELEETWCGVVCSIRAMLSLSPAESIHNCEQIWKISTINWTPAHWLANKQSVNLPDNDLTTPHKAFRLNSYFSSKIWSNWREAVCFMGWSFRGQQFGDENVKSETQILFF